MSLLAFEAMAVAAAMPAIAHALDGLGLYALAFGGTLAASVVGMVLAGASCDRHGARQATSLGLVVFAAGLLLAGFADDMAWVVAGRIVQGLGAGMLGVALYVGMGLLIPPALHPRLFALFAAAWVVPALLGPSLAAWMVGQFSWRSVFLAVALVVPLTAALLLPAFSRLPPPLRATGGANTLRPRIGWAVMGAGGALLLHAASQASGTAPTLLMLALGLGNGVRRGGSAAAARQSRGRQRPARRDRAARPDRRGIRERRGVPAALPHPRERLEPRAGGPRAQHRRRLLERRQRPAGTHRRNALAPARPSAGLPGHRGRHRRRGRADAAGPRAVGAPWAAGRSPGSASASASRCCRC